jgi:hypothetical protein
VGTEFRDERRYRAAHGRWMFAVTEEVVMGAFPAAARKSGDTAGRRLPGSVIALVVLLGLLALGALQGGLAMVQDPTTPLGMTTEFLNKAPIDDYMLAGWFLLGIGAASLVTIAGLVFSWRWRWAAGIERFVGYRWPWLGAIATGTVLLIFEIIELFLIPFHPIMHPLLIGISLALVGLPLTGSARRRLLAAGSG